MSGTFTRGTTITGGIQNIAGLLPLLETQQCEEHIDSALPLR
jgi:glutamate/tyrosine decarboxylase-like PLP-dependent enzyme